VALATGRLRLGGTVAQGLLYAAYPLGIYFAHTRLSTRAVGGLVLALVAATVLARSAGRGAALWRVLRPTVPLVALIAGAIALDDRMLLLVLPAIASAWLCAHFAWSLRRGPPMIERFARLMEDDLPAFTAPYCRRVTVLWCAFLGTNAVAIVALAALAPIHWWALYTGLLFYFALALLLGGEFFVRKWWFRYYGTGPVDRLLARWFPPEATANGRRSLAYVERRRAASASPQ